MIVSLVSTSLKWPIGCFLPVARLALFFVWTVIPIHGLYPTSRRPLWCTQQCGKMSSTNFTLLLAVISDYWNAFDSRLACVSVGFQARKCHKKRLSSDRDQYACEIPREGPPANNKRNLRGPLKRKISIPIGKTTQSLKWQSEQNLDAFDRTQKSGFAVMSYNNWR